ncbi:phenylacetate--CoA ligase family protein [Propionibacteriaceae bacterium Y2011]
MSGLERVYDAAPVAVQNLMTSVKGWQIAWQRYGEVYREHRRWLTEFDKLSYEQKREHQDLALARFVSHAYARSRYYRRIYDEAGVDVADVRSVTDLPRLPTVDKEDIRAHADEVQVGEGVGRTVIVHTGGTTGKSLEVTQSETDIQRRMAILDHFKHRVGFEHRRMRRASFGGRHIIPPSQRGGPYTRYNHACRQLLLSPFHVSDRTGDSYLDDLNRFRPDSLDGFPSSMLGLARHMLANDIRLAHPMTGIFPTAETLTDPDRELLTEAFGAKVFNQYASSEGAPFITECRAGRLHVEMSTGVFEFTDDEIFVTSFTTHATPLIRYRIGDRATLSSDRTCECGNESEMVDEISGRGSQFLYRTDGSKVYSPNLANLLKNVPNAIVEAQLQQHRVGQVDLYVVVDQTFKDSDDDILRDEFAHKFDTASTVTIHHVDTIPSETSGKRLFVKNLVDREQG